MVEALKNGVSQKNSTTTLSDKQILYIELTLLKAFNLF